MAVDNGYDQAIDASGLLCPLPILRAKKALSTMQSGQVLRVLTTDPHAKQDFQAFCNQTGNELINQELMSEQDRMIHYLKRR